MIFQVEKKLVLNLYQDLEETPDSSIHDIYKKYYHEDLLWRGFHPFNEIIGSKNVATSFWQPLKNSFKKLKRRMDIFLAGENTILDNKGIWVVSMGHLMGLFDYQWLGIKETRKLSMLPYCEFNKIENNKIVEVAMFFDIPHLMIQAGYRPFPEQTGAHLVQPGPLTHDGLMFAEQNPTGGLKTMSAIDFMVNDIKTWKTTDNEPLTDELRRSWNEEMVWWGPAGIGSTYTIDRYANQHSGPFRQGFKDKKFNGHICRVSEGHYGGFFGWPNLTVTPSGGFMGMPATGKPGDLRVIDMYRRDGTKLTENWVFIDLLHFFLMQGVDILARTVKN